MPNKSNKVVDLTTTSSSSALTTLSSKNFNTEIINNNLSACTTITTALTEAMTTSAPPAPVMATETETPQFCSTGVDNGSTIKCTTYSESPWNIIKMLELIEQFRQQPVLWDQNHPFYKNKLSRNKAWDNIADNMKMNKIDCEKKLNILRTQFRRECKRIKKDAMISSNVSNSASGSSNFNHDTDAGNNTEPSSWYKQHKASKWFAYRSMLFLADDETFKALEDKYGDDVLSLKKSIDTTNGSIDIIKEEWNENNDYSETYDDNDDTMTNDDTNEMQQSENYEENNLNVTPILHEMISSPSHNNSTLTTSRTATITGIKRRRYDQDQQETIITNNNNTNLGTPSYENYYHPPQEKYDYHDKHLEYYFKQNRNECLSYGEHIGYRLMRLPQKTRCIVMNIINSTLFEADMGKFDNIMRHKNS